MYSQKFIEMLQEKVNGREVTQDSNLKDLGIDSLDLVEIVLQAEEEFGISFSDDELNGFKTVSDVCKVLDQKQK
mgnify:CR=1 FL=1